MQFLDVYSASPCSLYLIIIFSHMTRMQPSYWLRCLLTKLGPDEEEGQKISNSVNYIGYLQNYINVEFLAYPVIKISIFTVIMHQIVGY